MRETEKEEPLMNRDSIARLLGVTPDTISDWARKEGMPVARPGGHGKQAGYLPSACVKWRLGIIQGRVEAGGSLNPIAERARKDKAGADLAEQTLKVRAGELVSLAEVRLALGPKVAATKTRIEAWPRSVAPDCARVASQGPRAVEKVLADSVRELLEDLAEIPSAL